MGITIHTVLVLSVSITVRFFASLQEQMGCERMELESDGLETVRDVCNAVLREAPNTRVLAAVNARHATFETSIRDGDEIAFFPPVTGG